MKDVENKKQVLVELFNEYKNNGGEEPATLKGYVEREADNDPYFFGWLFDNGDIEGYADLTDEQKQEYKDFLATCMRKKYKSLNLLNHLQLSAKIIPLCTSTNLNLRRMVMICLILQKHTPNMTL